MPDTSDAIKAVLRIPGVWSPIACGFEIAHDGATRHMSNAELEALHPKLPAAVKLLCARQEVSSLLVTELLQILSCTIHLRTAIGERVAVEQIRTMEVMGSEVWFYAIGLCYLSFDTELGAESCLVPHGDAPRRFSVSRSWLDLNYPDWYQRFITASALNCSLEETVQTVFSQVVALEAGVAPNDIAP